MAKTANVSRATGDQRPIPAASFTPGPWKATPTLHGEFEITAADRDDASAPWYVAVAMADCGFPQSQSEANAHLIAAAPDLYEALKLALECIAYCRKAHKDAQSGEGFPVEIILDAALAKAEGRP